VLERDREALTVVLMLMVPTVIMVMILVDTMTITKADLDVEPDELGHAELRRLSLDGLLELLDARVRDRRWAQIGLDVGDLPAANAQLSADPTVVAGMTGAGVVGA